MGHYSNFKSGKIGNQAIYISDFHIRINSIIGSAKKALASDNDFYKKKALAELRKVEECFNGLPDYNLSIFEDIYLSLRHIKGTLPSFRASIETLMEKQNLSGLDSVKGLANALMGLYNVSEAKMRLQEQKQYNIPIANNDNEPKK